MAATKTEGIFKDTSNENPEIKLCVIDKKVFIYHVCHQEVELSAAYNKALNDLVYIGTGDIFMLNGIFQQTEKKYHFWRYAGLRMNNVIYNL